MWTRLRLRLAALFRRARFEHELDDELAFHVQARADEWERRGLSPTAARRRARIEFGNVERVKEETRDVRLGAWLELLRQDLRYGFRVLRAHRGLTAIGVASLAFGMAVCIYFLSQLEAGILRPLPGARDPGSLFAVDARLSYPAFERIRERDDVVEAAAAYLGPTPFTVDADRGPGAGERVFGHLVSPDYFEALGVGPTAGRLLAPGTDGAGSEPAVVVSERFWRRRLDADPDAVGRTLRVNGRGVTLVGIAANGFQGVFPTTPAEIFVPVTVGAPLAPELAGDVLSDPEAERFQVIIRLAGGVSIPAAEAALDTAARGRDAPRPGVGPGRREGRRVGLLPAGRVARVRPAELRLMLGLNGLLVALVLSLACANLAGLLLARAGERRREMAVRFALGAGRGRLVRQLLTESVLLALGGGAAGLLFSYWLLPVADSIREAGPVPFETDAHIGPAIWLVVAAIAVLTGAGLGLAPALAATRGARDGVARSMQGGPAPLLPYRRFGARNLFVTYQVAAALMLLLTIGQLAVGYQRFAGLDPGFDTAGLTLFVVDPGRDGYTPAQSAALLDGLSDQLSALPEVRSAALAERAPLGLGVASNVRVSASASTAAADAARAYHSIALERVGVGYFETLGISLVRGRAFIGRDLAAGGPGGDARAAETAVVISRTAERQIFGSGGAIGRRLRADDDGGSYVVVGVVPDVGADFLATGTAARAFAPISAAGLGRASGPGATVLVGGMSDGGAMAAVRRELTRTHPRLTIFDARTMDEHLEWFERTIRVGVGLYAGLSLFGLVLATIGLTGVTAYAVARRRVEIGVRLALGARRPHVLWLVLREA